MSQQEVQKLFDCLPYPGLDFEYCPVKHSQTKTFMFQNTMNQVVKMEIKIDNSDKSSFQIEPRNFTLKAGQKKEIKVIFTPSEAKVMVQTAVISYRDGEALHQRILKMSGIGKFPFVNISDEKLNFEQMTVGKSETKKITLRNQSLVQANFTVDKLNDDGKDASFSLSESSGFIPPSSSKVLWVIYSPSMPGTFSCTQYQIQVEGGNTMKFSCMGEGLGNEVSFSTSSIHFGEVSLEATTNRLLNIINDSDQPTTFQIYSDKSNIFAFSKTEGTVKAKSQVRIIIEFFPQKAQNYYERVFCVVRNHQILYVDLLGACFDLENKPMPLMQRHIDIYRHKVIMGIHKKIRRDKEGSAIPGGRETAQSQIEGASHDFSSMDLEINQEIPIDDPSQVVLHKEMFMDNTSQTKDISLSSDFVDFNFTHNGRVSESKQMTVNNKFQFAIEVNWALLKVFNKVSEQWVSNPFKIRPEIQTIAPQSSFDFQADFCPYEPDQYFFQIAQCHVKMLNGALSKNKRLLAAEESRKTKMQKSATMSKAKTLLGSIKKSKYEDALNEDIDPPLCFNVRMVGHSFPPGSQVFIPMVQMNPKQNVTFPSCGPCESVYQTLQISNTSDTPVYYKILNDSTQTFRSYPSQGLIGGQGFAILCFEFNPRSPRNYNFIAQVIFNHNPSNVAKVHLIGHCYEPKLQLSNDYKLFFPPMYSGVSAKQTVLVKNDSRIPVEYEWKVPDKYKNEIKFAPSKAFLQPNEECKIVATFTALKKKDYHINVPIYAKNIYDHLKNSIGFYNPGSGLLTKQDVKNQATSNANNMFKKYTLEIIGRGSDGIIQIQPHNVNFGTITVGFNKTMEATVYNRSNCNIFVELKMAPKNEKQGGKNKYSAQEMTLLTKVLNENFQFDTPKGMINAKSKKTISITFKPQLRFDFDINLVCIARQRMDKEVVQSVSMNQTFEEKMVEKSFITVQAQGDYPLLRFEDVRNDQVSIANLWERYNMTKMNKNLLEPLNEWEKVFNNSENSNQSMEDLISNLTVFDWDFGKIPIKYGSKPRKITLTLKNIGGVDAQWQFKLPNDSEIEMEPWADPGEPSPEKAFEKHILDNKIFNVHPRFGTLAPGQQMELNVFYFPKEVKQHHLQAFLQILNGKPLVINLIGETLHRRAYMNLLKQIYYLPPTPIGLEWALTYPIEIKNLGITKLKYQIDTSALENLNSRNYDFRIFEIQNPEGTLAPNDTQYIYTLFRPLEAKEYSVDLPIKISDIEGPSPHSHSLRLRGTGYHSDSGLARPDEVRFYGDLPKCRAYIGEEGQMAAFSFETIDFGELECGQICNRFVMLYNMHQHHKLKFDFQKSGLMCGDNLKLEPMNGELEPNSHQNIKMTLIPSRFPTHFEGEIQCSIEWENLNDEKEELKSMHTNTNTNDNQELLFLRLKKRTKFVKEEFPIETRENETLFSNVMNEIMNGILHDDEMDRLLDNCHDVKGGIFNQIVTSNQKPPCTEDLYHNMTTPDQADMNTLQDQKVYTDNLKELTGNDDDDILRKTCFMDNKFSDMLEYMLEDTIFNLMEEATFEEFDLTQAPKIYIRKDQAGR